MKSNINKVNSITFVFNHLKESYFSGKESSDWIEIAYPFPIGSAMKLVDNKILIGYKHHKNIKVSLELSDYSIKTCGSISHYVYNSKNTSIEDMKKANPFLAQLFIYLILFSSYSFSYSNIEKLDLKVFKEYNLPSYAAEMLIPHFIINRQNWHDLLIFSTNAKSFNILFPHQEYIFEHYIKQDFAYKNFGISSSYPDGHLKLCLSFDYLAQFKPILKRIVKGLCKYQIIGEQFASMNFIISVHLITGKDFILPIKIFLTPKLKSTFSYSEPFIPLKKKFNEFVKSEVASLLKPKFDKSFSFILSLEINSFKDLSYFLFD